MYAFLNNEPDTTRTRTELLAYHGLGPRDSLWVISSLNEHTREHKISNRLQVFAVDSVQSWLMVDVLPVPTTRISDPNHHKEWTELTGILI